MDMNYFLSSVIKALIIVVLLIVAFSILIGLYFAFKVS